MTESNKLEYQLMDMGFEPCFRGFEYLKEAIILVRQDRQYLYNITKMLYPEISKKCKAGSSSRVERCIRHLKDKTKFKQYTNSVLIGKIELLTREN